MIVITMQVDIDIARRAHTRIGPEDVRTALQEAMPWLERQVHEATFDVLPEDGRVEYDVVVEGQLQ